MKKLQKFIDGLNEKTFIKSLINNGADVYVVGGLVRDLILNKENKDIDLVVRNLSIDKLIQILNNFGKVDIVGKSFGVIKFIDSNGIDYDIALPRKDKPTGEGGHKGFKIQSDKNLSIEDDLMRRDAKLNAMAININTGKFIDPLGGLNDIEKKQISAVNPDVFSDDPLRMLRMIGFAARFGFTIEPKTAKMIKDNAKRIKEISPERILTEFDKIVKKGDAMKGAFLLKDLGLTQQIFNGDGEMYVGKEWNNVQTMGEFLWLLAHHLVQDIAEYCKTKLKCDIETYKELKAFQQAFQSGNNIDDVTARILAHNIYKISPKTLNSKILPDKIMRAAQELLTGKYPKDFSELAINGNDLMNLGLKGKEIGDILKKLLLNIYSNKVTNNKKDLLSLANNLKNEINEDFSGYEKIKPDTWNVNGREEELNFFVKEYDKWNKKNLKPQDYFNNPTRSSVSQFLQEKFKELVNNEKLNKYLYWRLIDREILNENNKIVSYSAVVLDNKSRTKLIQVFKPMIPSNFEVIAHHMTIKMGGLNDNSQEKQDMIDDKEITLNVIDYAMDNLVMAVGVEGYSTTNEKSHITLAVNRAEGGKPFMSNKLNDWKPIGFPIELTGRVKEI